MIDHIETLRARLAPGENGRRKLLSVPGCWDGLSALMIEQAGFEAAFVSGGAVAMARLGRPDMGLTTLSEAVDVVATVRDRINLPILADGDTGFGNAINLQRTVRMFERAGASAIQIEDQGFPKRCGHMAGKTVVPFDEALGRVKAALDARHDMLVIARTDAVSVEGFTAAMDRAEAFIDAGADIAFVEGPKTMEDLQTVADRFGARVPLVHNLVEGGVTPTESGTVLEEMGFAIALHPLILLHGFVHAAPALLRTLSEQRDTRILRDRLVSLSDMNKLTGAADLIELGKRYDV